MFLHTFWRIVHQSAVGSIFYPSFLSQSELNHLNESIISINIHYTAHLNLTKMKVHNWGTENEDLAVFKCDLLVLKILRFYYCPES
jgi:hypothetical protein